MREEDPNDLLKLSEVARLLDLSHEYVRNSLLEPRGGTIPAQRVGGQWRVKRSDLVAWMEKKYHVGKAR